MSEFTSTIANKSRVRAPLRAADAVAAATRSVEPGRRFAVPTRWAVSIAATTVSTWALDLVAAAGGIGTFVGRHVSPDGRLLTDAEWTSDDFLPTDDDKAHVESLMIAVGEPGRMAGWVAPPSTGIHQQPADFEYVRV